jgi:transcriptional regulator with XRE-family HTH domain
MNVGNRLRKARENRNLSQLEVSKRTNINNKTLSRYENDGAEPDFNTLKILAELYDVPMAYFFDGDTENSYDLRDLLKDKEVMWEGEKLGEEEKEKAIEILNILLKKRH